MFQYGTAPSSTESQILSGTQPSYYSQLVQAANAAEVALRVSIDPERSTARYRVREQLAGFDFPNDAVGESRNVTGAIAFTAGGQVVPEQSRVVVDLTQLTSDSNRRDNYIKRRTLGTNRFPEVVFVLREVQGLPWPAPKEGNAMFRLVGDLTVRDRTIPIVWEGSAEFNPSEATGSAKTEFTFDDIGLEKPSVMRVLSVDDEIRLELNFTVSRAG